jgi:hypothetical protein
VLEPQAVGSIEVMVPCKLPEEYAQSGRAGPLDPELAAYAEAIRQQRLVVVEIVETR